MKTNRLFLMLIFILSLSFFVNAEILTSSEVVSTTEFYVPLSQSFKVPDYDYATLESIEVVSSNADLFNTPLYLEIRDDFNLNQSIYYSSKVVGEGFETIVFNLNDLDIIGGRTYWLEFTGHDGIRMFGDNSATDTYSDGYLISAGDFDLYFIIRGTGSNEETASFNESYTNTSYASNDEARYYYNFFNLSQDIEITSLEYEFCGYDSGNPETASYNNRVYIQKLKPSCEQNLTLNYDSSTCWETLFDVNSFNNASYFDITFYTDSNFQGVVDRCEDGIVDLISIDQTLFLDGGNIYRYVYGEKTSFGGTQLKRQSFYSEIDEDSIFLGSAVQKYLSNNNIGVIETLSESLVYDSVINYIYYDACNGDFCAGNVTYNETIINETLSSSTIASSEADIVLPYSADEENKGKLNIGGLFVTIVILLSLLSILYFNGASTFILISATFKILILCALLWFIPLWIPLLVLIFMIAWKIFQKFFISNGGN